MLGNYQTFGSKREATAAIDKLQGWPDARPERLYLPDDPNADSRGDVWVIQLADNPLYLRADGYAR